MRILPLLPLVLLLFAACSGDNSTTPDSAALKPGYKRVAFEQEGLTVDIPADWNGMEIDGYDSSKQMSHKMHMLSPECTKSEMDCPETKLHVFQPDKRSLDEIYESYATKMQDQLRIQKIIAKESKKVNGIPAIILTYEGEIGASPIKGTLALLKKDDVLIAVDATRDSYHMKYHNPENDQVMNLVESVRRQQLAKK